MILLVFVFLAFMLFIVSHAVEILLYHLRAKGVRCVQLHHLVGIDLQPVCEPHCAGSTTSFTSSDLHSKAPSSAPTSSRRRTSPSRRPPHSATRVSRRCRASR
ncbi:hypothetical protein FIBSPDRAFT_1043140 [Athelia psychrophila]|uniref:Secreted protein n=1 Tax=Athelia psychrophila TaxID=1759441 RepID=A0A166LI61_9AGAM|nr:hypothetical protein FIBSPDRAFT_1043140 [Fibularhizoctonia sp. CBS 109695]